MVKVDEQSVFLNVPFDKGFERLFVSLVAAIVALGRTPRCVLEVAERGDGRLNRIHELIQKCRVSIHDLSRIGTPVRFNMPFELGLAYSLMKMGGNHDFIITQVYRLDKDLWKAAKELKKDSHRNRFFTKTVFHKLIEAALMLSVDQGLLKP